VLRLTIHHQKVTRLIIHPQKRFFDQNSTIESVRFSADAITILDDYFIYNSNFILKMVFPTHPLLFSFSFSSSVFFVFFYFLILRITCFQAQSVNYSLCLEWKIKMGLRLVKRSNHWNFCE